MNEVREGGREKSTYVSLTTFTGLAHAKFISKYSKAEKYEVNAEEKSFSGERQRGIDVLLVTLNGVIRAKLSPYHNEVVDCVNHLGVELKAKRS